MSKTVHERLQWAAAYRFPGIRGIQSPRWAALVLVQFTAELSSVVQGGFPNQRNPWGNWESLQEPTAHTTTPLLWAYTQDNNLTWDGIALYLPTAVQSGFPSHYSRAVPAHGSHSGILTVLVVLKKAMPILALHCVCPCIVWSPRSDWRLWWSLHQSLHYSILSSTPSPPQSYWTSFLRFGRST